MAPTKEPTTEAATEAEPASMTSETTPTEEGKKSPDLIQNLGKASANGDSSMQSSEVASQAPGGGDDKGDDDDPEQAKMAKLLRMQEQQRKIEEENKQRKAMLAKAIADRSDCTVNRVVILWIDRAFDPFACWA